MRCAALVFIGGACLAASACGGGLDIGFGIATTVVFDSSVDDAALGRVRTLALDVTGDETFSGIESITGTAARTERFIYRPDARTRVIILDINALDVDGSSIARGQTQIINLTAGQSARADVVLRAGNGGFDLAGADLVGADLTGLPSTMDLSTVDAAGGDSRCPTLTATAGVLSCHGFESSADIGSVPSTNSLNGAYMIDTTRAFRGASSLHLSLTKAPAGATYTNGATYDTPPESGSSGTSLETHFRAFVYMTARPPSSSPLLGVLGSYVTHLLYLGVAFDGALELTHLEQADAGSSKQTVTSTTKLPLGTWACVELVTHGLGLFGVPAGPVDVFLNEVPVGDLHFAGNASASSSLYKEANPTMFLELDTSAPLDAWFDEVVVSNVQIGCSL